MKPKRIRFTPENPKQIVEHAQLEYIRHVLQECSDGNVDNTMVALALEYTEDIKELLGWKGCSYGDFWDD